MQSLCFLFCYLNFTVLFHCSIRQCPEVGEYLRRLRRIHHALREEDADHSLCRIGVGRCAEAPVPTESAGGMEDFVALNVDRHSEAPTGMRAEEDFGPCALLRRNMKRIAEASPRFKARMAGVLYFLSILTAGFNEFFVRGRLGFAVNLAAGLIEISGMVAVTLLLYDIFK